MIIDREELSLEEFNGEIEIKVKKLVLNIKGQTVIKELLKEEQELDLIINLSDNASLEYIRYGNIKKCDEKLIINQNNNTKMIFKESVIINDDSNLKIENNISGNNNISEIVVRATSNNNCNLVIDATLNVEKDTINNEVKEDLRGLEKENSKIMIVPNMLVASSEVLANHNVTIGNVSEEDLFYLRSKGLSENKAKKLLETGFLISIFDGETKEKIKEIIK